jgi:hypothetical protein
MARREIRGAPIPAPRPRAILPVEVRLDSGVFVVSERWSVGVSSDVSVSVLDCVEEVDEEEEEEEEILNMPETKPVLGQSS